MRWKCWLYGCQEDNTHGRWLQCARCKVKWSYKSDLNNGWLYFGPLRWRLWYYTGGAIARRIRRLARLIAHRCAHCGEVMWFEQGLFCSRRCCDDDLPF